MTSKKRNKYGDAIAILIIALVLLTAGFFYSQISQTAFSQSEDLIYSDLSANELQALSPMLVEVSSHVEVKLEGTFQNGIVGFPMNKSMSGVTCENTLPFAYSNLPPHLDNFLEKSGGDDLFKFNFIYKSFYTCGDLQNNKYDTCLNIGSGDAGYWSSGTILHSLITYEKEDFKVENCQYEERYDGIYTTYDIDSSVFCEEGQVIEYGIHSYTCIDEGQAIRRELVTADIAPTTYSYTQYDAVPITFLVELRDSNGAFIYPQKITELEAITSLSNGEIVSNEIEYNGNGVYEISSVVTGTGDFSGQIKFNFLGTDVVSPVIMINVEKINIAIDTSKVSPSAVLGETKANNISIFDSLGNSLTPDNVYIKVSYPDGITYDEITLSDLTKINGNTYSFEYTFEQVEKYTFDVYAEKDNYVKGTSKMSIISYADESEEESSIGFTAVLYAIPVGLIILFSVAYLISRKKKGKKRK